ncbi:hypothetical protein B0H11DRAFT_1932349 [Mycena galericulata]|nr:hypothetical protein B0H11DRAFT_1932349 [Mycena galericulata]
MTQTRLATDTGTTVGNVRRAGGPIGSERNRRRSHGNGLRGLEMVKCSNGRPTDPAAGKGRRSGGRSWTGGVGTSTRKACKHGNVSRRNQEECGGGKDCKDNVEITDWSPREREAGVAVPEMPEMEGNGMADMPEDAEGGNEQNDSAGKTNGPGGPEGRRYEGLLEGLWRRQKAPAEGCKSRPEEKPETGGPECQKTGGRKTSKGCRKDGRDQREVVRRIHRKPSIKEWKWARNTGPGVPERPERKGKSEDGKITWKKTRREEFCKDSKKYRGPKRCRNEESGTGMHRNQGRSDSDEGIWRGGWSRRAPECSGRPKCPDEVPKAGGRTGGVRRRPEQSEEDGNVVVDVGMTRKEWRKSGIKSAGGAGGLRGEEDHPCKDDQMSHREPSVKDWKGVKHSTGTMAYPMLVKPVTFAKVAYRIRRGPEQPEREMPECKMPEGQQWSHGRKPAEKSFRAKRCRNEIAGTGMIRSQAGAITVDFGKSLEKLPEEAQGLPGGTRRSGNVVPELETTGKEEEKIGMESGDGAGELRRTVENHPSRSGSVEILYGDNGLSDAGQDPGGSGTTGTRDAGVQDAGKATVVTWKKTRWKGFIKTPKNTEAREVVTNTRRWASPKRSATYNCNKRSERSEKLGSRGSDRENTKGEREAKSGWSENSGGGREDVQRNPHVRTEVRRDGHRSPKISIKGSGPGEDVEGLWRRHTGDRSDRNSSGVPFRNWKANTRSD